MKLLKIIVASILFIGFTALGLNNLSATENKFQFREVELKSKTAEIKELNLKYDKLNRKLDDAESLNDKEVKDLQKEKAQLEKEKRELEVQLHAKLDAKRKEQQAIAKASEQVINTVTNTQTASASSSSIGGSKEQWMTAAGIPKSDWQYVDYIVSKESGWDPCAYNPGQSDCSANPSSACGLAQSLPCGKQSVYGHWTDPVANLKWQYQYVKERYGGYAGAYSFWLANSWY